MVCNTICRAGGIIYDEDKTHILLVLNRMSHSKNENKWGLPKGHLMNHEYDKAYLGARREILEETGIFYPINENDESLTFYDTIYFIIKLNRFKNLHFEPRDKKEIHQVKWMSINKLKDLNVNRGLSMFINTINI